MSTAPGRFHTEPRIRAAYSEGAGIYRVVPSAVALPSSTAELAALMREAGFTEVRWENLSFGIACLHHGSRA